MVNKLAHELGYWPEAVVQKQHILEITDTH